MRGLVSIPFRNGSHHAAKHGLDLVTAQPALRYLALAAWDNPLPPLRWPIALGGQLLQVHTGGDGAELQPGEHGPAVIEAKQRPLGKD